MEQAPKRKIARHMRITVFPKIISIHLSRSIYDQSNSTKNAAKVSFAERLSLGGILNQEWFTLLAIVCHKGNHHSGHYETFRRNILHIPFSTPDALRSYAESRATSDTSTNANLRHKSGTGNAEQSAGTGSTSSQSLSAGSAGSATQQQKTAIATGINTNANTPNGQTKARTGSSSGSGSGNGNGNGNGNGTTDPLRLKKSGSSLSIAAGKLKPEGSRFRRKRKNNNRWWRISDERVKECKTSDVLDMQKEVYLLFYEMEDRQPGSNA